MKNIKKYVITFAGIAVVGGGMLVVGARALAADSTTTYPLIVQNIAEKFGLDAAEVQSVFTSTREEEHATRTEERLSQLVDDGVITEDQKSLIKTRMEEHQSAIEALDDKSMTMEERRTAHQELRTELESWAEENDIPTTALIGLGGPMGRGGHGGPGEMGMGMETGRGM